MEPPVQPDQRGVIELVLDEHLNRQVLHRTADIGVDKVVSAARVISELNPDVRVRTHVERLDAARTAELAADYDLVVDASDSFGSKYALNDGAVQAGKPLVHAGVEGMVGQLAVLGLPGGPCLRCVFPEPPPDSDEPRAILGAAAGVLGALEAAEALKLLAHMGEVSDAKMLLVNLWRWQFHTVTIHRSAECPVCGGR